MRRIVCGTNLVGEAGGVMAPLKPPASGPWLWALTRSSRWWAHWRWLQAAADAHLADRERVHLPLLNSLSRPGGPCPVATHVVCCPQVCFVSGVINRFASASEGYAELANHGLHQQSPLKGAL